MREAPGREIGATCNARGVVAICVKLVALAEVGGHRVYVVVHASEVVPGQGAIVVEANRGVGLAVGRGQRGMRCLEGRETRA